FPDHQNGVYGVSITNDGKVGISVAEDNNLRYWHATDQAKLIGKQIRIGGGHAQAVFKGVQHRDEKRSLLATCSADGTVRLWNPDNGTALKTLTGHTDWVYAVALSPDGSQVASGSWNGEVRVWNTADGNLAKSFNASPGYTPPETAKK